MAKPCTMMLAQNADVKRIIPGHTYGLYEKVDGVPGVDHHMTHPEQTVFLSRQKEIIRSARHISMALKQARQRIQDRDDINNYMKHLTQQPIVGELFVPGMSFKDAAGVVRRHNPEPGIKYAMFDIQDSAPFDDRRTALALLDMASNDDVTRAKVYGDHYVSPNGDPQGVLDHAQQIMDANPHIEGVMIRDLAGKYKVGLRSWDMQRLVRTPTIDLRVIGFEEAESAAGHKLGMVGKVIVSYNGKSEGVGPGKLTHGERRELWADYCNAGKRYENALYGTKSNGAGSIAEIKYKEDKTYKGLRQGTFQYWRPDKDVPDA